MKKTIYKCNLIDKDLSIKSANLEVESNNVLAYAVDENTDRSHLVLPSFSLLVSSTLYALKDRLYNSDYYDTVEECKKYNENDNKYRDIVRNYTDILLRNGVTKVFDVCKYPHIAAKVYNKNCITNYIAIGCNNHTIVDEEILESDFEEIKNLKFSTPIIYIDDIINRTDMEMETLVTFAKKHNLVIALNVARTLDIVGESYKRYDMSEIMIANSYGVFEGSCILIGCNYLSDEDYEILDNQSIVIVHTPSFDMKCGLGIAPICDIVGHKLNIMYGDLSNNNLNICNTLCEAALCESLQRVSMHRTRCIPYDVTLRAINYDLSQIGANISNWVLQSDYIIDIILLQTKDIRSTYNFSLDDLFNSIGNYEIETLIIGSKIFDF